jgi:hypothetical protein
MNTLDQLIYRLEQDSKALSTRIISVFTGGSSKEVLNNQLLVLRQMKLFLQKLYPNVLSDLQLAQIAQTTDKLSIIIFAQAKAYYDTLKKLLNEVNQLIESIK